MKRVDLKSIAALGSLALTLGLNACGGQSTAQPPSPPTTQPSITPPVSPPVPTAETQDQKLTKKIIGTWEDQLSENGVEFQVREEFYPSNEFSGTAIGRNENGDALYIRYSGTWKIQDGYLRYKIASSSVPELLPIGDLSAQKIVNISDKDLVYVDEEGRTQISRRVN
jgi:hypothetical protein